MTADTTRWKAWHAETRRKLQALSFGAGPPELYDFFHLHYAANTPVVMPLPAEWPLYRWTLDAIRARLPDADVQVQTGRNADPDYEIQAEQHRGLMRLHAFLDHVAKVGDNDLYLTAGNGVANREALAPLYADLNPMPFVINPPAEAGHIWIGGRTVTPLHHDLSSNAMCQMTGRKLVRMVSPAQVDKVDYRRHVFSNIQWLTEQIAADRGIHFLDVLLTPGEMLFLPVGWWHCCKALESSITVVFTGFPWNNSWNTDFNKIV